MINDDLNRSRIINTNDIVFRQNLEFYPNLSGLTCENNILTYKVGDNVIRSEVLTFDLRTLPGYVWNFSSQDFMNIIRFNKDCLTLSDVTDFISVRQPNNIQSDRGYTSTDIASKHRLYLEAINNLENLTDAAKAVIKIYQEKIEASYKDHLLDPRINEAIKVGEEIFYNEHPDKKTKSSDLTRTAQMQAIREPEQMTRSLVKKEERALSKSGFINLAILLYGTLNIGLILAIAFMK